VGEEFAPQEDKIGVLEAQARFDAGTPSFFIRVGRAGSGDGQGERLSYFLDLGDPSGRAIEICADGWLALQRSEGSLRYLWRSRGSAPATAPRQGSIMTSR
jgi:hypothetical protein